MVKSWYRSSVGGTEKERHDKGVSAQGHLEIE